jgi:surface antigen
MVSLAAGLFYLGYQIARVSYQIPAILDQVEQVSTKVDPVVDRKLVETAIRSALAQETSGASDKWTNAESGYCGSVTDITPSSSATSDCRTPETVAYKDRKTVSKTKATFCHDANGTWAHKG